MGNLENLVLEHLQHIRGRVDQLHDGVSELAVRLSGVETAMVGAKREVAFGDEVDARLQMSLDRLLRRIERIEKRLDPS